MVVTERRERWRPRREASGGEKEDRRTREHARGLSKTSEESGWEASAAATDSE